MINSPKRWHLRVLQANVVAQSAIVVTGAIVRLTSSGLGCPTWPECVAGSIAPTSEQTQAWHKWIEFGNRMLTVVLGLIALGTILAIRSHNQNLKKNLGAKRKDLTRLAAGGLVGIFAQAILGGITVLTGLNPLTVAAHFLVSIGLISLAVVLLWRTRASGSPLVEPRQVVAPIIYRGLQLQLGLALTVIILGTLVTGTGPHAGDSADIARLPFDPRIISWVHADFVLMFMGLIVGLLIALIATHAERSVTKRCAIVLSVGLGQGLIGYVQYFTGLPWVLVAFHVTGACILWIVSLRLVLSAGTDRFQLQETVATNT